MYKPTGYHRSRWQSLVVYGMEVAHRGALKNEELA